VPRKCCGQADVAKAAGLVHGGRSLQRANLRKALRRRFRFPAALNRLKNKFREGMTMKTIRDSARARMYKDWACGVAACAVAALVQSQLDICYAQPSVIGNYVYSEYVNRQYGYSICYPEDVFLPQGESVSGDGQVFLAQDGAKLRVHADYNVSNQTIQAAFKDTISEEKGKGVVTFKSQKGNWYVVSGKNSGNVFYQKTLLEGSEFITFRAVYPETASATYGAIVTAVNQCLKPLAPR
jgi:hypothetical protein